MCQVSLESFALPIMHPEICKRDDAGKNCKTSQQQGNSSMSLASAFCLSLTNVPLGLLASLLCMRLHKGALMILGSAIQHVLASLFSHIWQVCEMIGD